jgi:hypothetical protein
MTRRPRRTNTPNQAIYEQAPWDLAHIEAIYRNLQGRIVADGAWHDFPPLPRDIARYRVFEDRYFQAVYARRPNLVFDTLTAMPPVLREDDAEWTIWKIRGAYAVTSVFTVTPHFMGYGPVERWLCDHHELGWEPHPDGLQGTAYFTDLEPGCLADAMDRLVWLENQVIALNRRLTQTAADFWGEAKRESDRVVAGLAADYPRDEIIPTPGPQPRTSWKRRAPLPEGRFDDETPRDASDASRG